MNICSDLYNVKNKYAKKIAIVDNKYEITYEALWLKIKKYERIIKNSVSREGNVIAVFMERSIDLVATLLAIFKSGNIAILIDNDYPEDRINFMLIDSKSKLLLVNETSNISRLNSTIKRKTINEMEFLGDNNDCKIINEKDTAYIIYTSGSTGNPKGIKWSTLNIRTYLEACSNYYNINDMDIMIQQSSCSFDNFIEETLPILLVGGKLIIKKRAEISTHEKIEKILCIYGITLISASPILLSELNKCQNFYKLRLAINGGDVLRYNHISNLLENDIQVVNSYGPAECTICASVYNCKNNVGDISIGRPWKNYRMYVVDVDMKPIKGNAVGEIIIAGQGVALGYTNPIFENDKFINVPFEKEHVYRTGDYAYIDEIGNYFFIGRRDNQIKVNGYRMELEEIEKSITNYCEIFDVMVKQDVNNFGLEILCAYYTSDRWYDNNYFIEKLSTSLMPQMIPSKYFRVDQIPLTSNRSKKDRNKEIITLDYPEQVEVFNILECSNVKKKVIDIWSRILKVNKHEIIGDMNFMEMGGHSLNVMELFAELEEEYGIEIDFENLYTIMNINDLSNKVCILIRENEGDEKSREEAIL